jgi:transposase
MNQKYFIGVDLSKEKIDCSVILQDYSVVLEKVVKNQDAKIKSFILAFSRKAKCSLSEVFICAENTGIYGQPLKRVCSALGVDLWIESPLRIKRATSDVRGKSDRKDALRIAEYSVRYFDRRVLNSKSSADIEELAAVAKARETILSQRIAIENQLSEAKSHDPQLYKTLLSIYKTVLKTMERELQKMEKQLDVVLRKNSEMHNNAELMKSIPGVGKQVAVQFIIHTNNFKDFDSAKHLASYSGVVPFLNESGKLIRRPRVSKMANLKIKTMLHMAALSAVRTKSELKDYYVRKVAEGKNKMSVLNGVRNKLVHRIWAVIERQSPYLLETTNNY